MADQFQAASRRVSIRSNQPNPGDVQMQKPFNKWNRQLHRWVAIPTFLTIPLMAFIRLTHGAYLQLPPSFEMVQSLMILFLAITGAYLYFIPYLAKRRRNQRVQAQSPVKIT